jgi:hypothetical protein
MPAFSEALTDEQSPFLEGHDFVVPCIHWRILNCIEKKPIFVLEFSNRNYGLCFDRMRQSQTEKTNRKSNIYLLLS